MRSTALWWWIAEMGHVRTSPIMPSKPVLDEPGGWASPWGGRVGAGGADSFVANGVDVVERIWKLTGRPTLSIFQLNFALCLVTAGL